MNDMRLILPIAIVFVLAACGRSSTMDETMRRDLEAASAGAIELAPAGGSSSVVSAIESNKPIVPKVTPSKRPLPPAKSPPLASPRATTAAESREPAATRPATTPQVQSCPGGCKSVGEVLRNAPFPIKPVTKRP